MLEKNFKEMFAKDKQEFRELKKATQTVCKELKATNQDLLSKGLLLKEENGKLKEKDIRLSIQL